MSIEQNFVKDLSNLDAIVGYAADMQLHGSFSQRRPDLGKMFTCPHCRARRRVSAPRCCNPAFATTKRAWDAEQGFHQLECGERSNPDTIGRALLRKMKHKKHGQSRLFKLREQILRFQSDPELVKAAAKEMHVKVPDLSRLNPFVEKYLQWKQNRQARAERRRSSASRKINRGA